MKCTVDKNWYKEFATFCTRMEGTIRCSYLALFDAEDNFLFSIQDRYHKTVKDTRPNERGNFVDESGTEYLWNGAIESDGQVAAQFNINEWCTLNAGGKVVTKEAVVYANNFVDAEKVPVHLTEAARLACLAIVQRSARKTLDKLTSFGVWSKIEGNEKFVKRYEDAWSDFIAGSITFDELLSKVQAFTGDLAALWAGSEQAHFWIYLKRFIPMLQDANSTYYIYWWQCRWYPTHVNYTEREEVELEKTWEGTERLAKILAAASGVTLFT